MTDAAKKSSQPNPTRLAEAARIISSASKWSLATGLIPVPVIDLAALGALQGKMVTDLSKLYGQNLSKNAVRGVVSVLLGALVPGGVATFAGNTVARSLPGIGTIVGIMSFGGLGAAATYAIGKAFVRHYEGGGSFSSFDPKAIEADLIAEFAKAAKPA